MALGSRKYVYVVDLLFPDSVIIYDLEEQNENVDIQGKGCNHLKNLLCLNITNLPSPCPHPVPPNLFLKQKDCSKEDLTRRCGIPCGKELGNHARRRQGDRGNPGRPLFLLLLSLLCGDCWLNTVPKLGLKSKCEVFYFNSNHHLQTEPLVSTKICT